QFQVWVKRFYELMAELSEITKSADKDPNSKPYYISTTALQIAERTMHQFIKEEE
ncbi:ArsR family transcriptional regulator, partial [Bacillus toyonensis]